MYSVNFFFKNNPNALSFIFKAHKNASDLYSKAQKEQVNSLEMADDFGMQGFVNMSTVSAVTFNETEKDMEKNGQLQILQAKNDLKTQSLAKSDIGLQMLTRQANGIVTQ